MPPNITYEHLRETDPEMWKIHSAEAARQEDGLELIASENYTSEAVMEAQGGVLTNKYAEGRPDRRYYGGCEHVDEAEKLAGRRARELFGAEFANLQPHSGASANAAVYMGAIQPGDTVLGLDLAHGGHLTHGMKLNISGKLYNIIFYGVSESDNRIDFDQVAELADEHKPKMIVAGHSAYPRAVPHDKFRQIADDNGAKLFVDMAHYTGLVAGKQHQNPVPYADYTTFTTHKSLRGPRGGGILTSKENSKAINQAVFPGLQGGPLMHTIMAKGVCFHEAMQPDFEQYAKQVVVNAQTLAQTLAEGGLRLSTGGTDNHLMLVDVTTISDMTGRIAEDALGTAGITVNKNMIPFDERKPLDPSGIRIGTPALTTRGMKEGQMQQVGTWILEALRHADNEPHLENMRAQIAEFTKDFPVPAPVDREEVT